MKPHIWIVPLAIVTMSGCGDDGPVAGPSPVVGRGQGRAVAPFRSEAEFIEPSKECHWHYRPVAWYPWYAPLWICPPAR